MSAPRGIFFRCDGSNCPGLAWPVSDGAHPDSCRAGYDDPEANLRPPSFPNLWRQPSALPDDFGVGNLMERIEALPIDDGVHTRETRRLVEGVE